jgi:hypothetical protein
LIKTDKSSYFVLALFFLVICCPAAKCKTAAPDPEACRYSDQLFSSEASMMMRNPPTHFRLMASRYVQILQAVRGRRCTGTVTIGFTGHNYVQGAITDDPGISWLVATLVALTGLSVANTFDSVVLTVIASATLIGFAGFCGLYPDRRARLLGAAMFVCLALAQAKLADVYIFQSAPLVAGIPWVVHFGLCRDSLALSLTASVLAFVCSWCALVRIGTDLVCLAFLITLFVCRRRMQNAVVPVVLIILSCVPALVFNHFMIARRNAILAGLGRTAPAVDRHTVWHSIYIGLAFVPNSEVSAYDDSVAANKVRSIDPSISTASSTDEEILRGEVFKLARRKPMIVIENLVAKFGVLIVLAAILLFPARRFLFADQKVFWLDAAFVAAIAMSATSAILVIPHSSYLLTYLCLTCLYSCVKFCGGHFVSEAEKISFA